MLTPPPPPLLSAGPHNWCRWQSVHLRVLARSHWQPAQYTGVLRTSPTHPFTNWTSARTPVSITHLISLAIYNQITASSTMLYINMWTYVGIPDWWASCIHSVQAKCNIMHIVVWSYLGSNEIIHINILCSTHLGMYVCTAINISYNLYVECSGPV